jgi:hypothetical protein
MHPAEHALRVPPAHFTAESLQSTLIAMIAKTPQHTETDHDCAETGHDCND